VPFFIGCAVAVITVTVEHLAADAQRRVFGGALMKASPSMAL
jgi:hypothetical protein